MLNFFHFAQDGFYYRRLVRRIFAETIFLGNEYSPMEHGQYNGHVFTFSTMDC